MKLCFLTLFANERTPCTLISYKEIDPGLDGHDNHLPQLPPGSTQQKFDQPRDPPRRGIIEPVTEEKTQAPVPQTQKDERTEEFLKMAILENDFLNKLEDKKIAMLVRFMYSQEVDQGTFIIKEGEQGDHLYVSAEGQFEVHKQGNVLGSFGSGRVFGELALLYKVKRNASIRATTQAKVWVLNREVFKQVIISSSIQETKEKIKYLRSVPLPILKQLSDDNLAEMANFLVVKLYATGTKIVEQDENGDEFFIISGGSVRITKRVPGSLEQEDCGVLVRGDYFGEQALVHQVPRQATITALAPGVECLVLERGPFEKCFGGIQELKEKKYPSLPSHQPKQMYLDVSLKDLLYVATLGVGGFGRVKLVQHRTNKKLTFAIKCLKKQYVVEQQQVQHAYNEKLAMLECAECPFIVRLYRTYKDSKYVYYLMEPCLGGDLFTTLQRYKKFQEETVRFVVGCAVEALQFLHHRGFIYRDLKPENLLLDSTGYVKLTDFGFAKRIGTSGKTWTFAGTPDYMAPEVVLNTRGYDRAVDYWGLGILIYELLNGSPPFRASDPSKTYKLIMQGFQTSRFPKEISKDAKDLIKRLCNLISTERLGYQRNGIQDIRDHRWFKKFDWESLKKKRLPTPLLPQVTSNTDTQNFDPYVEDKVEPPEENSGWDKDF